MPKYIQPYENVILNKTAIISEEIARELLLFPFAYQQTKANRGEIAVSPNQIIA